MDSANNVAETNDIKRTDIIDDEEEEEQDFDINVNHVNSKLCGEKRSLDISDSTNDLTRQWMSGQINDEKYYDTIDTLSNNNENDSNSYGNKKSHRISTSVNSFVVCHIIQFFSLLSML